MNRKDRKLMTITISWPNADGDFVDTDFVDRFGVSKLLRTTPRTLTEKYRLEETFPAPLRFGKKELWKPKWIAEYLLAREKAVRSKKREAVAA